MSVIPVNRGRRLSVAMIAHNAADLIAASLDSIRQVADEIIVVDTGSTDRTRPLALERATKVVYFSWSDDFAGARNFALEHITGDWVFWLDAGEQLTPEAANALRTFVDTQADPGKGYLVMVQTPSSGHLLAGEQIGRLRLLPRRAEMQFTGRVREEVRTVLGALGMSIEMAPFIVQRGDREHDPVVKNHRAQRNLHLAALEIQEHGPLPAPLLAMAEACITLGEVQQGIEFYTKALQLSPRGSTTMLEAFYGVLTALDAVPGAREKQMALCAEGLEIYPFDAQLLCAMGGYLQSQGRLDLACRTFETAARFGQIDPELSHLIEVGEMATICHAMCQELLGERDPAVQTLETAIAARPDSPRLRRHLLEMYIRHDRRREALEQVSLLPDDTPHREAMRSAVRGACLAAKENWIPALAYLQTAYGAGCRDAICLRWLVAAHLAADNLNAAGQIVSEWQFHAPHDPEVQKFAAELERRGLPQSKSGINAAISAAGDAIGRTLRVDSEPHTLQPITRKFAGTARRTVVQPDS